MITVDREWGESVLRLVVRRVKWLRFLRDWTWAAALRPGRSRWVGFSAPSKGEGTGNVGGDVTPRPGSGPLRVGVIGCGRHVRTALWPSLRWSTSLRVVAVAVRSGTSQAWVERAWQVPCERDYRSLLARDDLDAVIVATPTSLHAQITAEAVHTGRHVLCEAPGVATAGDIRRLAALLAVRSEVVQFGYRLCSVPAYQRLRAVIQERAKPGRRCWRVVCPELYDLSTLAVFFNGAVEMVHYRERPGEAWYDLQFVSGDVAQLIRSARGETGVGLDQAFVEVQWDRQRAVVRGAASLEVGPATGAPALREQFLYDRRCAVQPAQWSQRTDAARMCLEHLGYLPELEAFVGSVRGGRAPVCGLEAVAAIFSLEDAMLQARVSGRPVRVRPWGFNGAQSEGRRTGETGGRARALAASSSRGTPALGRRRPSHRQEGGPVSEAVRRGGR